MSGAKGDGAANRVHAWAGLTSTGLRNKHKGDGIPANALPSYVWPGFSEPIIHPESEPTSSPAAGGRSTRRQRPHLSSIHAAAAAGD